MMVLAAARLNLGIWNDVSSVLRKKKGRDSRGRENIQIGDSIPESKPGLHHPRPGLSFCGFSDCTFRKVWSPMVAT